MANTLYDIGREGFLTSITVGAFTGKIDWKADDIYACLASAGYTPSVAHTSMTDVPGGNRLKTVALTGLATDSAGTAQASNITFPAVAAGPDARYIIIFRMNNTGSPTDADNALIALIDTATNLPATTNGGDLTVVLDGGSGKIFKL